MRYFCLIFVTIFCLVNNAQAKTNVSFLFEALQQKDWEKAVLIAKKLDEAHGKGDVLKAYARAVQAANNGDCVSAKKLSAIVIKVTPGFLPAYEVFASCLIREGNRVEASKLYQNLANRLPEGSERELAQQRADALQPNLKPRFGIDLSIVPSSNTSRRTSRSNTGNGGTLSEASRAQDGVTVLGTISLTKPIFNNGRILTQVSLKSGLAYDTVTEKMRPIAGIELRNNWLLSPKTSIYAAPFYEYTWSSGDRFFNETGLRFGVTKQISKAQTFSLDASYSDRNFVNDSQDARYLYTNVSITHIIGQNDKLQFSIDYSQNSARSDFFSLEKYSARIEWQHLYGNGFITSLEGSIGERKYDTLAPLTDQKREDRFHALTAGLSHKSLSFKGIRPEFTYTYTSQSSNDLFNDFEAHDIGLRLRANY